MASDNKKGNANVMIVLGVALVIGVVVFLVALINILGGGDEKDEDIYTTTESVTSYEDSDSTSAGVYVEVDGEYIYVEPTPETTENGTTLDTSANLQVTSETSASTSDNGTTGETSVVEYYEQLSPNGDNKLSDDPENEFISIVNEKYGVSPNLLVAVYSVPDTGNNWVLEFAGSKDKSGNIIKSPDTLSKIYLIDKDRNIKIATRTGIGNVGVDTAEGLLSMELVKKFVMTQYPNYFTGLD